jgi:signal peptide peptidase SppA
MNTFLKRLSSDVPLVEAGRLFFMLNSTPAADQIQMAEHPALKKLKSDIAPKTEMRNGVAIVPVQGALAYNPDALEMLFYGVEDSRNVLRLINNAASDPDVKGILLRMDTPGGMLMGGPEMADAVANARRSKPVVAHIGGMGASLGYMIASQANQVIANRSAVVGSIGVIASITDYTDLLSKMGIKFEHFTNKEAKYKAAGALGKPLTDDQRDNIQQSVDSAFQMFKSQVQTTRPQVKDEAMQGQTFRGDEAKKQGLIDRVGDEDFAFTILKKLMPEATSSGPYIP